MFISISDVIYNINIIAITWITVKYEEQKIIEK